MTCNEQRHQEYKINFATWQTELILFSFENCGFSTPLLSYRQGILSSESFSLFSKTDYYVIDEVFTVGKLNLYQANFVLQCITTSPYFKQKFEEHVARKGKRKKIKIFFMDELFAQSTKSCAFLIYVTLPVFPRLDYLWCYRINNLIWKRLQLDDAMNWLNTLGGGYSALGDYNYHHAESAAQISMKQLKIALEMGDPPTMVRCKLYLALSFMQRGKLRRAKYMLRFFYRLSVIHFMKTDPRLINMCKGLWSRLQYLYKNRQGKFKKHRNGFMDLANVCVKQIECT